MKPEDFTCGYNILLGEEKNVREIKQPGAAACRHGKHVTVAKALDEEAFVSSV